VLRSTPELRDLIPERKSATYDVREVVRLVVDDGEFRELWPRWAGQIVTGLLPDRGDLGGHRGEPTPDPRRHAGHRGLPEGRPLRPVLRLVQSPAREPGGHPGFLPGKDLEWRGMIRHGAELAFAYAQATVPRICLILRKAFGGAYIVMDSRGIGNDVCLAWPAAEIAVMGASGAVQILHRGMDAGRAGEREIGVRGVVPESLAGLRAGPGRPGDRSGGHPDRALLRPPAAQHQAGARWWAANTTPGRNSHVNWAVRFVINSQRR
jgi:hypothetical protein